MSYSKLHRSLVYSSLWTQSDNVRILFITLLSLCDQHGEVEGSRSGLARIANISIPDGSPDPWGVLMGPDKDSSDRFRNPENDGRRIEEMSGGFRILNHGYYRGLRNEDDRREQNRRAQARFQARKQISNSKQISQDKPSKATESHKKPPKAHTDTDTEEELISYPNGYSGLNGQSEIIEKIYKAYPRHTKRPRALRAIQRALKIIDPVLLLDRTRAYALARKGEDPAFIPHPATWFNDQRYMEDPKEWLDRCPRPNMPQQSKITMLN